MGMYRNRFSKANNTMLALLAVLILALCAFGVAGAQEKPVVTLAPDKGKAEAGLKISGKGFKPGEEVDVVLLLGEGMRVGLGTAKVDVIVADQSGGFEAESAIPKMAKPGEYRIDAIGSKGSEAAATLQVLPKE